MSSNLNISLPYPVLGLKDDYPDSQFIVTPEIDLRNNIFCIREKSTDVTITNEYLDQLLTEDKIDTAYKVLCSSTLFCKTYTGNKQIEIPADNLANHVSLEVFLVAKVDIPDFKDDSFNQDYFIGDPNRSFEVKKGYIVGMAGTVNIPLNYTFLEAASSMFKFRRSLNAPISIDTSDQQIEITYPYEENELDIANYLPVNGKSNTFLNLFIIPALTQAFTELREKNDNGTIEDFKYKFRWAMTLAETYPEFSAQEPYISSQDYLMQLLAASGKEARSPVLVSFDELKKK